MFTSLFALNPARRAIVKLDLSDGTVIDMLAGFSVFPDAIAIDQQTAVADVHGGPALTFRGRCASSFRTASSYGEGNGIEATIWGTRMGP